MTMADLKAKEYQRFEDIKRTTEEGVEFWYARELARCWNMPSGKVSARLSTRLCWPAKTAVLR